MSAYPAYSVVPVNGASLQLGVAPPTPVQPNDQRWCTLADANVILKVFTDLGVADAQILDASVATINGEHFINVDPASPARPYYLTSSKVTGPVGPALWIQYGPNNTNGGGRGNPGNWIGVLTGNPQWVPISTGIASTPVAQPVDSSGDANAFAGAQGVTFANAMATSIANTERLVIALAAKQNIT